MRTRVRIPRTCVNARSVWWSICNSTTQKAITNDPWAGWLDSQAVWREHCVQHKDPASVNIVGRDGARLPVPASGLHTCTCTYPVYMHLHTHVRVTNYIGSRYADKGPASFTGSLAVLHSQTVLPPTFHFVSSAEGFAPLSEVARVPWHFQEWIHVQSL